MTIEKITALVRRVRADVDRFRRNVVPAPPCGAMSPKLGATVGDLRRMGFLDPPPPYVKGRIPKAPRPPRPWRRVCVCALGHDGDWHRADDGQVWHRAHELTAEQAAAEDTAEAEELRRRFDEISVVVGEDRG